MCTDLLIDALKWKQFLKSAIAEVQVRYTLLWVEMRVIMKTHKEIDLLRCIQLEMAQQIMATNVSQNKRHPQVKGREQQAYK